jgi:WhiB family redox-sensing transcriptional regulator
MSDRTRHHNRKSSGAGQGAGLQGAGNHDADNELLAWADSAGCANADPDLFFPPSGADTGYARSICRSCPVRRQCLDYALHTGQKHGIWGGMTESQRRRLRRRTHPSNAPAQGDAERVFDDQPVDDQHVDVQPVGAPVRHLQLVR